MTSREDTNGNETPRQETVTPQNPMVGIRLTSYPESIIIYYGCQMLQVQAWKDSNMWEVIEQQKLDSAILVRRCAMLYDICIIIACILIACVNLCVNLHDQCAVALQRV